MTIREFIKEFNIIFGPYFQEYGFRPLTGTDYIKEINDLIQLITFVPSRKWNDNIVISAGLGLTVRKIAEIFHPEEDFPTVGMPLHLLKPDQEYYLFECNNVDDIYAAQKIIKNDIETYVVPFFNKYKCSADIFNSLKSDNPSNWFMCTNDDRDSLIVSFTYLNSGKTQALRTGEMLFENYKDKLPKYSKRLKDIISKLDTL